MAMYGAASSGHFGSLAEIGGAPIILLEDQENRTRLSGIEARKANLLAGIQVANTVKTSFGPKGMDKIVITGDGSVIISNDGATILKKMPVDHECAKLLVQLSQSQDDQIGDGTTGIVILAGALLQQSLKLIEKKMHPLTINRGFDRASEIACREVEKICNVISHDDRCLLVKAAKTALCSKVVSSEADRLAEICVDAVLSVADFERRDVNLDLISIEGKPGGSLSETYLIDGIALDKEFSHCQMEKTVADARIALLTCPFEPPKPKTKHKLEIRNREAFQALVEQETKYFNEMVEMVSASSANVILCQWGFDDEANHLLLKKNLPSVRWVSGKEIEMISLATGATIIPRFEDISDAKLGHAKCVREISMGTEDDRMILIEGCPKARAVTIIVRCGNLMAIQEAKRCLHDAICVIRNIISDGRIVAGGGAPEMAASLAIMREAEEIENSDQDCMLAFAEALCAIPYALAENSGYNALEAVGHIRSAQVKSADPLIGFNCYTGVPENLMQAGVFESVSSKIHQIALATQVVQMILKIDDIIVPKEEQGRQ